MIAKDTVMLSGFKLHNGLDSFADEALEKELALCSRFGLNADKLRKFNYNALQLSEIRKGLDAGVDIQQYLSPKLSWLEMEEIRLELMQGIDMSSYREQGFSSNQVYQIRRGIYEGIDVSVYAKKEFLPEQMKQIRKGLAFSPDFPVIFYLDPEFDCLQMREIRKGLQAQLDVSTFAHVDIPYMKMRVIRESAEDGLVFDEYQIKRYSSGVLNQMHKAFRDNVDLGKYITSGYDAEQLEEIRHSLIECLPIDDYLSIDMRGDAIREIRLGLEHGVLVDQYADAEFNWQQMYEMRLGLEHQIDITPYCKPLYWANQMKELRLGLEEGLDISKFSSMMFTAKDMRRIRQQLLLGTYMDSESEEAETTQDFGTQNEMKTILFMLDHKSEYLSFSHENMICWLTVPEKKYKKTYTEKIVQGFLSRCGIKQGIDPKGISDFIKDHEPGKQYLVASGIDAIDGTDGYYEYFFNSSGDCLLKENEDGTVDLSGLDQIVKVNVGDKLAVYHRATKGIDGCDVFGKKVIAKKGKEIPIIQGEGFMILNDRVTYVAKYTGALSIVNGDIFVQKILVMSEVKITDKIIRYDGTVLVTGDVNSGSEIHASGNIIISGHMESSLLVAGGDVSIKGGATCPVRGGIEANGNVSGKYFEGVKITANNVYAGSFINCTVLARGIVKTYGIDGVIYGGSIQSLSGVETAILGTKKGAKTILSIGAIDSLLADFNAVKKAIAREEEELKSLESEKLRLQELGAVTREMLQWKIRINAAVGVKEKIIGDLEKRLADMDKTIKSSSNSKAIITQTLYSGVIFVICGVVYRVEQDRRLYSPATVKIDSRKENILIL
ncbi:DUF342 domain-containing protein [Butyrivibrio sp. CB08]|uniref:DUF342 domain-containing protein n=1 Tax=Butyrivibrio sp. CB08 TaxID=2364879 RepID=UPI000EA937CB|nr:FapA family protein [Butyrivibrio sp. CB08]RKM61052.1 DUF342 domain-containing protein [Butyrivibrio sp. CB08]